jgi:hypothetical protein
MDQYSGGSFEGSLIPVLVFGPGNRNAWPPFDPLDVLVSADMLVSEFALYVSVSFLEYSFVEGVALPVGLQLRLMPGDLVVPDTDSFLLYPPSLGSSVLPHLRCLEQG